MNEEEKLKKFLDITLEAAGAEGRQSVESYEAVLDQTYDDYVKAAERKARLSLSHSRDKLIKDMHSETARRQIEIRRDYSHYQSRLKEQLFEDVAKRLREFMKTGEYREYISRCISKAADFGGGSPMTIYAAASDDGIVPYIKEVIASKKLENAEVIVSEDDFTGGLRIAIPSCNVLIDESFDSKLSDEKHKFNF